MPLEVEQKFRVDDHSPIRERLVELGAKSLGAIEQSDQYFAHPCRDFRDTGEALRIRQSGGASVITYKGAKLDSAVKTRPETELPLGDLAVEFSKLLQVLGFERVAVVRKNRDQYVLAHAEFLLEVALDDVDKVGSFVEVEAIADGPHVNHAQAAVVDIAAELGLTELEPRSYLRMQLEGRDG